MDTFDRLFGTFMVIIAASLFLCSLSLVILVLKA